MQAASTPPPEEEGANIRQLPPSIILRILWNLPLKSMIRFKAVSKSWRCMISEPKFIENYWWCIDFDTKSTVIRTLAPPDHLTGAASTPNIGHIPPEILEQILVNLPAKSLLRFSTVSKSWSCIIESRNFIEKHKSLAARERIITIPSELDHLTGDAAVCKISVISSEIEYLSDLCPVELGTRTPHLLAFCDDLWLVGAQKSLFLCNYSIRRCRKLWPTQEYGESRDFIYGLAYDSAADDYKVLKIARHGLFSSSKTIELYSRNSNSWKIISSLPLVYPGAEQKKLEFVNGAFHWICKYTSRVISFDLSTEKYGEIALPAIDLYGGDMLWMDVGVVVLRGKLCVSSNNSRMFALWVMEEYGVEESWTNKLDIEYTSECILFDDRRLRPFYIYDNGDILFNVSEYENNTGLFIYEKESDLVKRIVAHDWRQICGGFIYVESLVSPWPRFDAHEYGRYFSRKITN